MYYLGDLGKRRRRRRAPAPPAPPPAPPPVAVAPIPPPPQIPTPVTPTPTTPTPSVPAPVAFGPPYSEQLLREFYKPEEKPKEAALIPTEGVGGLGWIFLLGGGLVLFYAMGGMGTRRRPGKPYGG